jgi:hypothetical protein
MKAIRTWFVCHPPLARLSECLLSERINGLIALRHGKRERLSPHGQRLENDVVTVRFDKQDPKMERRASARDAKFCRT